MPLQGFHFVSQCPLSDVTCPLSDVKCYYVLYCPLLSIISGNGQGKEDMSVMVCSLPAASDGDYHITQVSWVEKKKMTWLLL